MELPGLPQQADSRVGGRRLAEDIILVAAGINADQAKQLMSGQKVNREAEPGVPDSLACQWGKGFLKPICSPHGMAYGKQAISCFR